jgi:hypothetical protein
LLELWLMMRGFGFHVVRYHAGACLLLAFAGCTGMWFAEREPWRREAELACLQSGAVKEGPTVSMVKAINGPGTCGADYPLRVTAIGGAGVFGLADDVVPAHPPSTLAAGGTAAPAALMPAATLACPLVSRLDRFVTDAVQPAARRWFGRPVVEIKQISAYSCRGMNGDPYANISEHAFGNALDIAAFTLADGRKVTVKDGWHGTPEEQGFLRDIHGAACKMFTTVLAPGSNPYHDDHMHVDLMRSPSLVCQPAAIPGEVAAARRRGQSSVR